MYVHDPLGGGAQNSFAVYTKLWYLPTAAGGLQWTPRTMEKKKYTNTWARYPIRGYSHIKNCGHVRDMVDF